MSAKDFLINRKIQRVFEHETEIYLQLSDFKIIVISSGNPDYQPIMREHWDDARLPFPVRDAFKLVTDAEREDRARADKVTERVEKRKRRHLFEELKKEFEPA